jgi:hypothetical protein
MDTEDAIHPALKTLLERHKAGHFISLQSRLTTDLRFTPEDADALLVDFANTLNVDMSNFRFDCYFASGYPSLKEAFLFLINRSPLVTDLTIADLQQAMQAGTWPEIPAPQFTGLIDFIGRSFSRLLAKLRKLR